MKPILFSTPMAQAILDGRKTMTRRVIKPQPVKQATQFERFINRPDCGFKARFGNDGSAAVCDRKPPYQPGDILWVRETWQRGYTESAPCDTKTWTPLNACVPCYRSGECSPIESHPYEFIYKASPETYEDFEVTSWRPSIHMPREAARIFLRVTDVWVERLQEISVQDAKDEGIKVHANGCVDGLAFGCYNGDECKYNRCLRPIDYFSDMWDSLNAKSDYSWDANPWVWVISFERCEQP